MVNKRCNPYTIHQEHLYMEISSVCKKKEKKMKKNQRKRTKILRK